MRTGYCTLYSLPQEGDIALGGPLWLWDTIHTIFGSTVPAHSLSDLEQGSALQQTQAAMQAALLLGPL